jgi:hypothetical protein
MGERRMSTPTQKQTIDTMLALTMICIAAEEICRVCPIILEGGGGEKEAKRLQESIALIYEADTVISAISKEVLGDKDDEKKSKITWKDLTGDEE